MYVHNTPLVKNHAHVAGTADAVKLYRSRLFTSLFVLHLLLVVSIIPPGTGVLDGVRK